MRTPEEMMNLIISKARHDERIRAVVLEGSRANPHALVDQYSDFDVVYIVTDIHEFIGNEEWLAEFGEVLIRQCPMDWYNQPYDYNSYADFTYLIQCKDGNRIDLRLVDLKNLAKEKDQLEPRKVLINKDGFSELFTITDESVFYPDPPTTKAFYDITNEFYWLSIYVAKGLCRKQIFYAKHIYDAILMDMLIKVLTWKLMIAYGNGINLGLYYKYLPRYLNDSEIEILQNLYPNGHYEDMWQKLLDAFDYFTELVKEVASYYQFTVNEQEIQCVRQDLIERSMSINC